MTDWFLSHTTHSSSFNPQLVLSLDHPPVSESWSEYSGLSGLLKKSSALTKHWHSPSERFDHLRISSLTGSISAGSDTSDSRALTPRNPPENFYFFRVDCRGDRSDEIGSGDSLASVVQDASIRPADLVIPVHNVALECGFVLSRISANSDEVIGYKSPVFQKSVVWGKGK